MITPQLAELIHHIAAEEFPGAAPRLIEAVVWVESAGKPAAISPAGAIGLMQLMPATAAELGVINEARLLDPEANLRLGCRYLRQQFEHFPEIPQYYHRISCALASYNGGRGYVNRALELARMDCGCKKGEAGPWQRWDIAGPYLHHPRCTVENPSAQVPRKLRPHADEILRYVASVRCKFHFLNKEKGK